MEQVIDISKNYSLDEYIQIDQKGPDRHEYFDGKLIAMPGESILHNTICLQLATVLNNLLKQKGYTVCIEDVKLKIEGEEKYVYPDVTVMKAQPSVDLPHKDYIIYSPFLIAEILSDSTRKSDLTDKFILYQKSSTLRYYLAIEQDKHLVILYEKDEAGEWMAKTFTGLNEIIHLPVLNISIGLTEIYSQ